jgi:hypothetical protein
MRGICSGCLFLLLVGVAGCGDSTIFPVEGKLVFPDGTPVTTMPNGRIEFETADGKLSAFGTVRADGTFRMSTNGDGDGAPLGVNRVAIFPAFLSAESRAPSVLDKKYEDFETSGLTVTVEAKRNVVTLTVEPAKRRGE